LPGAITVVQADQIYLPRHALPPSLIARLIRLAAFQNPEFYATQAMRRSTHDKPRIISCAELTSHHVAMPRGCFDAVLDLFASLGIAVTIEDSRFVGAAIPFVFTGALRSDGSLPDGRHRCGRCSVSRFAVRGRARRFRVHRGDGVSTGAISERLGEPRNPSNLAVAKPGAFERVIAGLITHAGEGALDRLMWASGATVLHAESPLRWFWERFQFSPEMREREGLPEITEEIKRKILGLNYLRMHGLDVKALAKSIEGDEFAVERAKGKPEPYATTYSKGFAE
jgi:hypothetical protein